jgi:hypothetical protein
MFTNEDISVKNTHDIMIYRKIDIWEVAYLKTCIPIKFRITKKVVTITFSLLLHHTCTKFIQF